MPKPKKTTKHAQEVSPPKETRSRSQTKTDAAAAASVSKQKATTSKSQPKVTAPPARKSKSAPKSQKVIIGAKAADTSNENESPAVLYAQGSFVAFIDKMDVENGMQQIAIGKVVETVSPSDKTFTVHHYAICGKNKLTFKLDSDDEPVSIADYQVICSVDVAKELKTSVTLSKAEEVGVAKLLNNIYDSVRDKINAEIDAENDANADGPSEKDSDSASEEEILPKKPLVKAKRQIPAASQAVNKSAPARTAAKKARVKVTTEESNESEAEEPEEVKGKVGKKRAFPAALAASQPNPRKVRKLADSSSMIEPPSDESAKPKAKKAAPKKPVVFKLGKWNPDTVVIEPEQEIEWCGTSDQPMLKCCIRCNARNVIRAVQTNNMRLLKACINDKKNFANILFAPWSVDAKTINPVELIFRTDNLAMLEAIYKLNLGKEMNSEAAFSNKFRDLYMQSRVGVRPPLLTRSDQGSVSFKAYGTAIRSVQMTRGNRQGNQAFVMADHYETFLMPRELFNEHYIRIMSPKALEALRVFSRMEMGMDDAYTFLPLAVRTGNIKMAAEIVEKVLAQSNYGFNQLHLDVLKCSELTDKYHTASITKKSSILNLTPLHFAALNPNQSIIAGLLKQNNDFNVVDTHSNKPIHYAAMCSGPGPLQALIESGSTIFDVNGQKQTPLHFAAMNSRPENVRVILQNNLAALRNRDRQNKTAFVYALESGDIETIKAFLDHSQGKVKVNAGQGIDRMGPLAYAAAYGRIELAQFLLERKARVLSKDKFQRTPLIMAVRNGHTRLASLLLQQGSDWKHKDSSNNTPLHYAAASGFIECIDLLVRHGADMNAENIWKVAPITIAMLNNHTGTVKRMLQEEGVDVNGKDDKGRTLLSLAMQNLDEPNCVDFVRFLLEKGANPNLGDVDKTTCLHILAASKFVPLQIRGRIDEDRSNEQDKARFDKALGETIELLLKFNADLSAKTESGKTPFEVALECDNVIVLELLSKKVSLNATPQILHNFKSKIFDERFRELLVKLLNTEDLKPESINCLDSEGFTPFLQYVNQFVQNEKNGNFAKLVRPIIEWNVFKHKTAYEKYTVTNRLCYDHTPIDDDINYRNNRFADQQSIPEIKLQELIKNAVRDLFTLPFIAFLKQFVGKGADAHAKVDRLEFYRELDEHKRHMQVVGEGREAAALVQQIDTAVNQPQTAEVRTRKQVLLEQKYEAKGKKSKQQEHQDKRIPKALREFYAKKGYQAKWIKRDGKYVEVEYSQEHGLQNAMHLIFRFPNPQLYKFLVSLNVKNDETDFQGRNPFLISAQNFAGYPMSDPMQDLLSKNIRFDLADSIGRTPFLIYYQNSNLQMANQLLDKGANINAMDQGGLFALKYALIRRNDSELRRLCSLGANINQLDNHRRNLLHHAVNMSSATADATFETEQTLIDLGVDINARDCRERVPLHYAFVKINDWQNKSGIDPIETVSSLCGQPGLQIQVADKWQKTPLHYASMRGASICTLYLINRGANLESTDIYGNTPLGISLMNQHFNYAILLIQQKSNVCLPVYKEWPNRLAKQWKDEAKQQKKREQVGADVEMHSGSDSDAEVRDTGRDLFKKRHKANVWDDNSYYGSEQDSEESESESDDDGRVENVFNNQNAFAQNVYKARPAKKVRSAFGNYNNPFAPPLQPQQTEKPSEDQQIEKEEPPMSAFRHAIRAQQQGLAYLILDNKYDYMLAMQDALDERKFYLVLTLLSKTADNSVVQKKNELSQNLMHILAKNSQGGKMQILQRIYDQLRKRGVNCLDIDSLGNNALHYAVESGCYDLCQILIDEGIDINAVNKQGFAPVNIYFKGMRGAYMDLRPVQTLLTPSFFDLFSKNGANLNLPYPEDHWEEPNYKCTIMINMVRHCGLKIEVMRRNLHALMEAGARLDTVDSNGIDLLMHSVMQNNETLVNFFLNNADIVYDGRPVSRFWPENRTNKGDNTLHYVVQPFEYGSFENVKILELLCKSQLKFRPLISQSNKEGHTPSDLARRQKSGVMSQALISLSSGATLSKSKVSQNPVHTFLSVGEWPTAKFDFTADSQRLLDEAESKRVRELKEEEKDTYVPLDKSIESEKQYKVFFEGEGDARRPWDVYMTKVDLKNGAHGDYVFYKMQMVYDSNRDLYIVITRYGRIGEIGMHQRTPFGSLAEAKKEFCDIFKQKSSNEWETAATNFVPQPKKYQLVNITYKNIKHEDYLAPFDWNHCPESQLVKAVRLMLEEICNLTMFQRSLSGIRVDTSQLPLSRIDKATVKRAQEILQQLKEAIKVMEKQRQKVYDLRFNKREENGADDLKEFSAKLEECYDQCGEFTSKFYQLIPMVDNDYWSVRPIVHLNALNSLEQNIEILTNIEYASRILLGALYRQTAVNPMDYVLDSIQVHIQPLAPSSPEGHLIYRYVLDTSTLDQQKNKLTIFKVQRKGEGERYRNFEHLENRRLLFHGTKMSNMLGILGQGLRIAPPEAAITGYMFGKGIYLADLFKKSENYSSGNQTRLMLMCEAALGNQLELFNSAPVENLPPKYNSIKARGRHGANYEKLITTPEGFQVPMGKSVENPEPTEAEFNKVAGLFLPEGQYKALYQHRNFGGRFNWPLQMNEFVVYNVDQVKIRYIVQWE